MSHDYVPSFAIDDDVPTADRQYADVDQWVAGWFTPTWRRSLGREVRWCRGWHDHPEAVLRLTRA